MRELADLQSSAKVFAEDYRSSTSSKQYRQLFSIGKDNLPYGELLTGSPLTRGSRIRSHALGTKYQAILLLPELEILVDDLPRNPAE